MNAYLRYIIGAILATSALTKAWDLLSLPQASLGNWILPRSLSVTIVGIELALATLFIWGIWPRVLRLVGIVCFGSLALVAGYFTLQGVTSCGCFGRLHVPPWITLTGDLVIVVGLVLNGRSHPSWDAARTSHPTAYWEVPLAISAFVLVGMFLLNSFRPIMVSATSETSPMAENRIPGSRAGSGEWLVVCYRSTCPHCRRSLGDWLDEIRADTAGSNRRWALLNVDEEEGDGDLLDQFPHEDLEHWRNPMPQLTTPLVLQLHNGIVIRTYLSVEDCLAAFLVPSQRD